MTVAISFSTPLSPASSHTAASPIAGVIGVGLPPMMIYDDNEIMYGYSI